MTKIILSVALAAMLTASYALLNNGDSQRNSQTINSFVDCNEEYGTHELFSDGRDLCKTPYGEKFVAVGNLQKNYDDCVEEFGKEQTESNISSCFDTMSRTIFYEPPSEEVSTFDECSNTYSLRTLVDTGYCIDKNGKLFEREDQ